MDGQNIKLPDFLIADLYKNNLVEFEEKSKETNIQKESKPVIPKSLENIKYLGQNGKRIIVITNHENDVFLPEDDLTFLSNILKACNLNLADIAIINIAKEPVQFATLKSSLNASIILMFNIDPTSLMIPFSFPNFQVQNYDGVSMLLAPSLKEMNSGTEGGKALKLQLWTSLKKMFGV